MTSIFYPYLGKPGAMRRLPGPTDVVTADPSLSETAHTLASGGTAVTRMARAKHAWSLPYPALRPDEADVLKGFYLRLYGSGPWRFVDPTQTNALPYHVSVTGGLSSSPLGWSASSGTLTIVGTPPDQAADAGVLTWTGQVGASATLLAGAGGLTADPLTAPVWLPSEFCAMSMWVKAAAGATVRAYLLGCNANGASVSNALTTAVTTTGAWQRVVVVASPNEPAFVASAVALVTPCLSVSSATAVSMSGAQIQYGSEATSWRIGAGCPRVTIPSTIGRSIPAPGFSGHTLNLAEV